jgi:hypothetical protein
VPSTVLKQSVNLFDFFTGGQNMNRVSLFLIVLLTFALTVPGFTQVNHGQGKRQHRGGKIFKKMDKNNDHQISRDEWLRKPKAFDRLDQNNDGVLTDVELKEARKNHLRQKEPNPTPPGF